MVSMPGLEISMVIRREGKRGPLPLPRPPLENFVSPEKKSADANGNS